jgi:hypothetical protein
VRKDSESNLTEVAAIEALMPDNCVKGGAACGIGVQKAPDEVAKERILDFIELRLKY